MLRFVLAFFLFCCAPSCLADEQARSVSAEVSATAGRSAQRRFFELDQRIIMEGIALARFNIHFYRKANEYWWLRGWLYPFGQEAGTGTSLAGSLVDLSARADAWNNPSRLSVGILRRGQACGITGNIISGSSSTSELLQNGLVVWKADQQGFSPSASLATVKSHLNTIDELLAERGQLVANSGLSESENKIRTLEGLVMGRIRDQLVYEFRKRSSYSRELMWQQNTFYTLDVLQNFTQMTSGVLSVRAFHNSVLKGPSGITSLAASSVAALNPAVSTLLAHQVRMRRKAFLAKALPYRYWDPSTEPTAEWVEAQELLAGARGTGILKDLAFLSKNSARYDRTLDREITRINRLREVARQQAISGPIIGLANVAQSLSATIAAYSFTDAPINGNRLLLAGRISKIGGQGYSMANTGLARFRKTFYDRRLKKQGLSPDQVFEERLRRLDKLETQVKAATPPDESRY